MIPARFAETNHGPGCLPENIGAWHRPAVNQRSAQTTKPSGHLVSAWRILATTGLSQLSNPSVRLLPAISCQTAWMRLP